jgi:aspartate aminotransferase
MRNQFAERRALLLALVNQLPLVHAHPPDGAFYVWLDVRPLCRKAQMDSMALASYLLEQYHVATIPGDAFGMNGYLRLSFATSADELERAIERFSRCIDVLCTVQ